MMGDTLQEDSSQLDWESKTSIKAYFGDIADVAIEINQLLNNNNKNERTEALGAMLSLLLLSSGEKLQEKQKEDLKQRYIEEQKLVEEHDRNTAEEWYSKDGCTNHSRQYSTSCSVCKKNRRLRLETFRTKYKSEWCSHGLLCCIFCNSYSAKFAKCICSHIRKCYEILQTMKERGRA
eukprot:Nk52_evm1s517 gene=Nk52_evmTU1s517